jgi:hypothetical protein
MRTTPASSGTGWTGCRYAALLDDAIQTIREPLGAMRRRWRSPDRLSSRVMSLLTEYFVASAPLASGLAGHGPSGHDVPAVITRNVDPVKLASLYRLAGGTSIRVGDVLDEVAVDDPNGPWLFAVRDEVATAIGGLADEQLPVVGRQWAETEEWRLDRATGDSLVPVVSDFRDLARQVELPTRRLYLWICL